MGYTEAQARDFINKIAPLMQIEAKGRGYKIVSTAIAQAIIESAANTSVLGYKYANYFGLKCGSNSWKGGSVNLKTKEEYTIGSLVTIRDNFRTYLDDNGQPSMSLGVKGYYDFVSSKRYQGLYSTPLKDCINYRTYAEALKKCGYATSSAYVNTLCKTVEKYNLTQYDFISVDIDEIAKDVIDGKYGSGNERKKLLGNLYSTVQTRVNEMLKNK